MDANMTVSCFNYVGAGMRTIEAITKQCLIIQSYDGLPAMRNIDKLNLSDRAGSHLSHISRILWAILVESNIDFINGIVEVVWLLPFGYLNSSSSPTSVSELSTSGTQLLMSHSSCFSELWHLFPRILVPTRPRLFSECYINLFRLCRNSRTHQLYHHF
jgi:hypothetical protein